MKPSHEINKLTQPTVGGVKNPYFEHPSFKSNSIFYTDRDPNQSSTNIEEENFTTGGRKLAQSQSFADIKSINYVKQNLSRHRKGVIINGDTFLVNKS